MMITIRYRPDSPNNFTKHAWCNSFFFGILRQFFQCFFDQFHHLFFHQGNQGHQGNADRSANDWQISTPQCDSSSFLEPGTQKCSTTPSAPPESLPPEKNLPDDVGTAVILWITAMLGNILATTFSFNNYRSNAIVKLHNSDSTHSHLGQSDFSPHDLKVYATFATIMFLIFMIALTAIAIWRYSCASKKARTVLRMGTFLTVCNAIGVFIGDQKFSTISSVCIIIAAVASAAAFLVGTSIQSRNFFQSTSGVSSSR